MLGWGVAQGMHVMGTNTPYDFLHKCTAPLLECEHTLVISVIKEPDAKTQSR